MPNYFYFFFPVATIRDLQETNFIRFGFYSIPSEKFLLAEYPVSKCDMEISMLAYKEHFLYFNQNSELQ